MAKAKDKPFRITCTCDNAFKLAEGREESINEWLDSMGQSDRVEAIKAVILSHYEQEVGQHGKDRTITDVR